MFIAVGTWLGAVAWGFRNERLWARPLAALFWPAVLLASPLIMEISPTPATGKWDNAMLSAIAAIVAPWYFYRKRTVRSYYAALSADQSAQASSPSAGG